MTIGGVNLGEVVTGLLTPRAPSNDILNHLIKDQPEFYKFIDIDLSTARTDQIYDEPGTFIWVDNQFARGEVTLKLNELKFGKFDLRRQKYIQGPFFRFFITNVAGQGSIRLFISRGYQAASEPIEAINRAELAARLGSINTFDRRGDIVWMDSFNDGLSKWEWNYSGTSGSVSQASNCSRNGGYSCLLKAGSTTGWHAEIKRKMPIPTVGKMGIEFSFAFKALDQLSLFFDLYDGTTRYASHVWYDYDNDKFVYADHNWANQDLLSIELYASTAFLPTIARDIAWHTMKIVVDWQNERYTRFIIDNTVVDMSEYGLYSVADGTLPHLYFEIKNYGEHGVNGLVHVDDVIVTQNEP